ncbi:hypothetical protein AB0I10_32505 [Streptomyces sp. NPDC050636]|uniref:hypothetical protein n=1 Tax=Streptomyces sp. NPDC050636 TaxID=3154510 RepID=UPI00343CF1FC
MSMTVKLNTAQARVHQVLARHGLKLLRCAMGVVYVWFGVLKVFDCTPVGQLVRDVVPGDAPGWSVPALGAAEIIVGAWFLIGRRLAWLLPVFVAHMLGTFSVLLFLPDQAYIDHRPWQLSMTGEFVVKNIVVLAAGTYACTHQTQTRRGTNSPDDH